MVACRNHTRHNDRVDETASHTTSGLLENNGEWTGVAVLGTQARVVVWYVETDDQDC